MGFLNCLLRAENHLTPDIRRNAQKIVSEIALLGALCLCCATPARADPGITDTSITIGSSVPLTGPSGVYGRQQRDGVNAYFAKINREGGVNGRKLTLDVIDDGYEVARAVLNTHKLIFDDQVFALVDYYGSATTIAALEVSTPAKVPLIGSGSGATALHSPTNRYMFNTKASYAQEASAIVKQALAMGQTRVAVLYQNDAFGLAGLSGVEEALKKRGVTVAVRATVERNSVDVKEAVHNIATAQAQTVIMVSLARASAEFVREMAQMGATPSYYTLSPVGADVLVQELGESLSRGVAISQTMPFPFSATTPLVSEFTSNMLLAPHPSEVSYLGLEGYLAAKILVEGIRRCGRSVSRECLVMSLESMDNYDAGGYRISFSAQNHSGSSFVDLTVIGANGKILK